MFYPLTRPPLCRGLKGKRASGRGNWDPNGGGERLVTCIDSGKTQVQTPASFKEHTQFSCHNLTPMAPGLTSQIRVNTPAN